MYTFAQNMQLISFTLSSVEIYDQHFSTSGVFLWTKFKVKGTNFTQAPAAHGYIVQFIFFVLHASRIEHNDQSRTGK